MIGSMLIGEIEYKANIRFKNVDNYENYIDAIDVDDDSEAVIFTGWLRNLNTPEFNKVNISQYGRGTDFKEDVVEYTGNNCYIPTRGNCCIKCIKFLSVRDFLSEF